MADDLMERLNSHAEAFDGLMALIPAKHYYAEDTSDQWKKKKQTKEEKRAARKAKLNPASHKSAKDVMDENERKRKREIEEEAASAEGNANDAQPKQPVNAIPGNKPKKQKLEDKSGQEADFVPLEGNPVPLDEVAARKQAKAERRKAMREEKKAAQKVRAEARKALQLQRQREKKARKLAKKAAREALEKPGSTENGGETDSGDDTKLGDIGFIDVKGIEANAQDEAHLSASPQSDESGSPVFDVSTNQSAHSSTSSAPPASGEGSNNKDLPGESLKKGELSPEAQEALKVRLQARIDALRAARKADGIDGKPARSRQELMEARRQKEQQRKAHKKEVRMKAKQDQSRTADAEAARLSGSNSPFSAHSLLSPRREEGDIGNNLSFGRVAFDDGQQMDSSLTNLLDTRKKKGPQDPRTALEAAKKRQSRIAGFDDAKRADIAEKDVWLNAKKHAHGEKVRDDTNLLKKALKRKENSKNKSEKEWGERLEGIEKGKMLRQKRKEENMRIRKEKKAARRGKGKKKGSFSKKDSKKVKRPGFEGSFKAKSKS